MKRRRTEAQKIQRLKTAVAYTTVGAGAMTGLFFLARHFYKKAQANRAEKNSLNEGDPALYAKQLKMAFENDNYFGWGTNYNMVKEVFREIPTKKMYNKVMKSYFDMYGTNLNADLKGELDIEEFNTIIRVLNAKK